MALKASIARRVGEVLRSSKNPLVARASIEILNLRYRDFLYFPTSELLTDTLRWIKSFPQRFDMVVGIPRAGMIPASIIATQLNLPLTIPDSFPRAFISKKIIDSTPNDVLIVDDVAGTGEGGTMDDIVKKLQVKSSTTKFWKGSVYVKKACANYFDLYYRVIGDEHRVCEWNIQHDKPFAVYATDLDGVLCEECPGDIDADEIKYASHLLQARPYLIPGYEIDYIITGRLEKYRQVTEAWLARQGIKYRNLIMWNIADKSLRTDPAQYKVKELLQVKPAIFLESRHNEAELIARKTGIRVYCVEHMNFAGRCLARPDISRHA